MMIRKLIYGTFTRLATPEAEQLEKASHNPRSGQLQRLTDILEAIRGSSFDKDHGLKAVKDYAGFRSAIPIADYERFRPYIDRMLAGERKVLTKQEPFMFATTSGTTGKQKFIPITKSYMDEFRRASKTSCVNMYQFYSAATAGCALSVLSPHEEGRTPGGTPYGAMSGALYVSEPEPVRKHVVAVPYEVYCIKDYETKYYCILRAALSQPITSIYTLNPSTIVLLASRLKQYGRSLSKDLFEGTLTAPGAVPAAATRSLSGLLNKDKALARRLDKLLDANECLPGKVWPDLQLVSCWTKAAAAFYLSDFPNLFGDIPIVDITYGASEGRGTVFITPEKQMLAIRSHFFEFIPEEEIDSANPTVLLADELTVGANYYILFSTSAGLLRYNINDVVKVTGWHNKTPLLEFQYKGGNVSSFTGEKVTELQVTEAMSRALQEKGVRATFFTVIPQFDPAPHYSVWLEPVNKSDFDDMNMRQKLASSFDRELGKCNIEYRSKRDSSRLDQVSLELLEPGSYISYRKEFVACGVPDSQIKVSHLNPKPEVRDYFQERLVREAAFV